MEKGIVKVVIFGAGGIIGQTMRLYQPADLEVIYTRRHADLLHRGVDLTIPHEREVFLERVPPDVILNLAGENRTDEVEKYPSRSAEINVAVPERLAQWCDDNGAHYIHVSSQAVFSGDDPPYGPDSRRKPVNKYGEQKCDAEDWVMGCQNWTIVRPTFVLGIRPLPHVGRQNPLEQMLANPTGPQVNDRWFSPLLNRDAAVQLWRIIREKPKGQILHIGSPVSVTRYSVAEEAGCDPVAVSHDVFEGLAARPADTTYTVDSRGGEPAAVYGDPDLRYGSELSIHDRAREISLFLGFTEEIAYRKLKQGFAPLHQEVAGDYRRANPQTDEELQEWYRTTESYIWELSAYHLDEGFNYTGTVKGITESPHCRGHILCVGDGIGDLTLALRRAGKSAVYHDLAGSRTAAFAEFRFWMHLGKVGESYLNHGWMPALEADHYDTILCLDFLEHVTDVSAWCEGIFKALKPGGIAFFQNAFGAGSGPEGSIPMHLARNDRYEKDWTPLMADIGYKQIETSNWWRRPARMVLQAPETATQGAAV
jgi:dTDP-4-dehydrorhamnose reductase